jgi:ribulose-5-phosphate 4-epimerase/fuculose-1-phosphate aldolase
LTKDQIVHGRSAYSADSGSRYLRGYYTDRGEMQSTYRARVDQGRFSAAASGPYAPDASAWCIHGTIHRRLPEAQVVLHCHSPYATALACLKDPAIVPIDNNTARFTGARPMIWPSTGSRHGGAAFRLLKGAAASADIAVSAAGGPMVPPAVQ